MGSLIPFVILLIVSLTGCVARNVVMLPMMGGSHFMVMDKLGKELLRRGHEVLIVVGPEAKYAIGKPHVRTFTVDKESKARVEKYNDRTAPFYLAKLTAFQKLQETVETLSENQKLYCDLLLRDEALMNEIKHSDMMIGDSPYLCSALVADKFNLPHVVIVMATLATPTLIQYGVSQYPSYVPMMASELPADMGLQGRIKNLAVYIGTRLLLERYMIPFWKELKDTHNISPDKSVHESLSRVDLILLTKPFILDYAQPIPPYVKEVGNFSPRPPQPLSADLEAFMKSSGDEGVIIVSFGTLVDAMEKEVIRKMATAFSRLPQRVIWRLKHGKEEVSFASNVKALDWVPQNDILGHNKTRLFITHGGANGISEAAYHAVPMVCNPLFGDQFDNAKQLLHAGIGDIFDVTKASPDHMVSVIQNVISKKKYQDNAIRISKVLKRRPHAPVKEAADHVEYVLALGRMDHLKPRSLYMPFYQVYMLDVIVVLLLALALFIVLLVCFVRFMYRYVCKGELRKKKMS